MGRHPLSPDEIARRVALREAGLPHARLPSHILVTLPPKPTGRKAGSIAPRRIDPDKPSPEQIRADYVAWLDRENQIDKALVEASRRPVTGRPRLVLDDDTKQRRRQERNTQVQAARRKAARSSELLGVPLPRSPLPPMPEAEWVPPPPPPPRPANPKPKYLPPLAERRRLKAEHKIARIKPQRRPAGRKTREDLLFRHDRLCTPDPPPDPNDPTTAPAGIPPLHIPEPDFRFDMGAPVLALLNATTIAPSCRIPVAASRIGNVIVANTPMDQLFDDLERFPLDPLGFVMWAFPWGEPGTPLEDMTGPEEWQREQMVRIGKRLREGGADGCVIEEDVSSGHGIGKSAMVSWMILWAISTFEDTRGVITANTDSQLRTKTWAELAKWYEMFLAKPLFKLTATAIYLAGDPVREKKWRVDQAPWSKENTEAFAGMHNLGKRILVIFDEAAAIDDHIYEVTEGALTDARTQIIWLRYGNPTRTAGRFFKNCSEAGWVSKPGVAGAEKNRDRGRNTYTKVDSRTVSFSNKKQIQAWVDDYGEDSDFVRVRVKGEFPRAGYSNFISPGLVTEARKRKLQPTMYQAHPKILSVDPARFGDDSSVITLRQGLKVHWQMVLQGFDGPDLASRIFEICRKDGPMACIAYDAIGNGADLDSALRRMVGLPPLVAVQWGQPAKDQKQFFNQRSECWGTMRDWLANGQIPDDDFLAEELTSLDYGYDAMFRIQLQSKKDIKRNGGKSPDRADSLALSYVPELIDRKIVLAKVRPVVRRKVVWSK